MKRFFLLSLVLMTSVCSNAQWKIGKMSGEDYFHRMCEMPDIPIDVNNRFVYFPYSENSDDTFNEYYVDFLWEKSIHPASFLQCVEFTGLYLADICEPNDEYVSIRKGPGTNFRVVGKMGCSSIIVYQETNTDWLKVYSQKELTIKSGRIYDTSVDFETYSPDKLIFLGYIHKDKVKSPELAIYIDSTE